MLTGVVEEDVGDGVDAGLGALDEGVGVEGVPAEWQSVGLETSTEP